MNKETKICSKCGIEKSIDKFHKEKKGKNGYMAMCKECKNIQKQEWRAKNRQAKILTDPIEIPLPPDHKICATCGWCLPFGDFNKRTGSADGHRGVCKKCRNKQGKNRIAKREVIEYPPDTTKTCTMCGEEKLLSEFDKCKSGSLGVRGECKECTAVYQKGYYWKNKEHLNAHNKEWREENKERKKQAIFVTTSLPDGYKICSSCKECLPLDNFREYRHGNICRDCENANARVYRDMKYKTDARFKLNHNVSSGMLKSLKTGKQGYGWESLVGYSLDELMQHLQAQAPDISWQTYLDGDIHLDHIIPIAAYIFESYDEEDFKKCWSKKNLRLISAEENILKGDKIYWDLIYKIPNYRSILPKCLINKEVMVKITDYKCVV